MLLRRFNIVIVRVLSLRAIIIELAIATALAAITISAKHNRTSLEVKREYILGKHTQYYYQRL